jgi:hypothetical protein
MESKNNLSYLLGYLIIGFIFACLLIISFLVVVLQIYEEKSAAWDFISTLFQALTGIIAFAVALDARKHFWLTQKKKNYDRLEKYIERFQDTGVLESVKYINSDLLKDVEYLKTLSEGSTKYEGEIRKISDKIHHVNTFFESLGFAVKNNRLDMGLLSDYFEIIISQMYPKLEPVIVKQRETLNQPSAYENFTYLYHKLQELKNKNFL